MHTPSKTPAGDSAYARYLSTDVLLSLQRDTEGLADPDEMVFLVVQQSSELWLKLAATDLERALRAAGEGQLPAAVRMTGRVRSHIDCLTRQLDGLDHISPWAYQQIRTQLENGSGFDSPGWRRVRTLAPQLSDLLETELKSAGVELEEVYRGDPRWEPLFQFAEALLDLDVACMEWRSRHLRVVERLIGTDAVGVAGTPIDVLARLATRRFYPRVWEVRSRLTAQAPTRYTGPARTPGRDKQNGNTP
ncbi:tryptophan 2,3-dioxygenase [Streptomyces sp. SID8359]|uniref:tryptophan 2,3-dioxygenase family protein n=1 Tax=unclassified Streptomyces TaxID=2593676 RepID=UPI00067AA94C|nr:MULTISPECIES: tryptophan 2,3-dioxygenase family protein [unclassified Streptomyces]MYT92028.1 tryptophan 2,3-dioxygenase [Streptomyces sp. SID8359]